MYDLMSKSHTNSFNVHLKMSEYHTGVAKKVSFII